MQIQINFIRLTQTPDHDTSLISPRPLDYNLYPNISRKSIKKISLSSSKLMQTFFFLEIHAIKMFMK